MCGGRKPGAGFGPMASGRQRAIAISVEPTERGFTVNRIVKRSGSALFAIVTVLSVFVALPFEALAASPGLDDAQTAMDTSRGGGSAGVDLRDSTEEQPNVVFFMLDDISVGFIDAMPNVRRLVLDPGVTYKNGFVPTSLCCPSRASTLTGNYAHTTGVYGNQPNGHGGWGTFQASESSTLATHLREAGYQTALVGKYLNGFGDAPDGYTPAGWNDFVAFGAPRPAYYHWSVNGTEIASYGDSPEDYSTDVLTDYAVGLVNEAPTEKPLFLYFAPYSAHAPYIPAPRHRDTWHPEPLYGAFNEADMSDKPGFMRNKPLLQESEQTRIQQRKHEMLMSADEGFGRIYRALGERVENTLFVLMSDNGFMLGDHRMSSKDMPYNHAARVQMGMRWDGHLNPGVSQRLTVNVDLTATIAEAADVQWSTEGRSVLSLGRGGTVLEQMASIDSLGGQEGPQPNKSHPAYCGYRTSRYLFVEWDQGFGREFYDYSIDPSELRNAVNNPAYADVISRLRSKAKRDCSPVPFGFSWR